ncbi:MAG TPA: hypothetical protein VGC54_05190, partial [Planctomycetota bacterium]
RAPAKPPTKTARTEAAQWRERLRSHELELATANDELGRERRRREQLREELADARAQIEEERRRAAGLKKRLADATEASTRERVLEEEAEAARRSVHVMGEKLRILEEEREDLHGVLQDHDHFSKVEEKELPSFRDRPLLAEEHEQAAALAARAKSGRQPFRILVIGGGEPQMRHRGKFGEYAEVMGFRGEWRIAEYTSWHKEMAALSSDMESRFDALVILHWNRTTFTRKAREICNRAGQRPCLTCHYEGFTSLRQTLRECLRQLLAAAPT